MESLTIQVHLEGEWHEAATVGFREPDRGIHGATVIDYEVDYLFGPAVEALDGDVVDRRALSVRCPASLDATHLRSWPSWLLDLLPQGVARARIAAQVGLPQNDPRLDLQLLRRAGGGPIGNLRIKEAHEAEAARLTDIACPPLADEDIERQSQRFLDVVNGFADLASGATGVQGEWPKLLMTRSARDGLWYPEPFVETHEGIEHVIIKLPKSGKESDRLILESEAPYLEIAREFGLNVGKPLMHRSGVLLIPRFDRSTYDGHLHLHGQESLVSAKGISEFAHRGRHEGYLEVIRQVSADPAGDTLEYVLRDLLNFAMGNPDNHGRNAALSKPATGGVRLSPLFDFAPMRMSDAAIGRATRWACLDGGDYRTGWGKICETAACDVLPAEEIRQALLGKIPFLEGLRLSAREMGVPADVIDHAFHVEEAIAALEQMASASCPGSSP
jgi:serine/threonine-protein kinase HipA